MAIGEEAFSEEKQKNYIDNSILTVKRVLELINFTLLSGLWDSQQHNLKELTAEQKKIVELFFSHSFEREKGLLELLKKLFEIYQQNNIKFPIRELENWSEIENNESEFVKACEKINQINLVLDSEKFTLLDCFEAEKQLTTILISLNFLAKYRMVSMKAINYESIRNEKAYYLHNYTALGINMKSEVNPERVNYTHEPINTNAILLFKGNYNNSINLFPFVIDWNALTFEGGTKICFYASRELEDDSLNYRFLENNEIENIIFKNADKTLEEASKTEKQKLLNELMKDEKKSAKHSEK